VCAFRFKLDSRLEFLPQNFSPADVLGPRCMDDSGYVRAPRLRERTY
jgi:hypothetical protein